MSTLTVQFRGLDGIAEITLPEGSTVGDAREAAGINEGLSVRGDGTTLGNDVPLRDEQILVTTPPEAKHGLR